MYPLCKKYFVIISVPISLGLEASCVSMLSVQSQNLHQNIIKQHVFFNPHVARAEIITIKHLLFTLYKLIKLIILLIRKINKNQFLRSRNTTKFSINY